MSVFEFVRGEVTIDPTGKGARADGQVVLRNRSPAAIGITFIASETVILLDTIELGGGALEVTHAPPMTVTDGGEFAVKVGGGASSEDADTNAVSIKTTLQIRWGFGIDDEQFVSVKGVTSGNGQKETVALTVV